MHDYKEIKYQKDWMHTYTGMYNSIQNLKGQARFYEYMMRDSDRASDYYLFRKYMILHRITGTRINELSDPSDAIQIFKLPSQVLSNYRK